MVEVELPLFRVTVTIALPAVSEMARVAAASCMVSWLLFWIVSVTGLIAPSIAPPVGLLRVRSTVVSLPTVCVSMIGMTNVLSASPGLNVSVPVVVV